MCYINIICGCVCCVVGAEFEKQPFLPTEPVRLTPAWEETNLPNDELNFKEVTMENAQLEMNPPFDRFVWFLETKMKYGNMYFQCLKFVCFQ